MRSSTEVQLKCYESNGKSYSTINACRRYCLNVAYKDVRDYDSANDIVQIALIRAYYALEGLTRSGLRTLRVRPWLYRIVSNAALDYIRAQSKQFPVEDPESWLYRKEASDYDDPERIVLYAEDSDDLERLLDMLPGSYRQVIEDVVLRARSYEGVAEHNGMNVIAVRTRYHRAVQRLAKIVRQEQFSESDLRRWLEGYDFVRTRNIQIGRESGAIGA